MTRSARVSTVRSAWHRLIHRRADTGPEPGAAPVRAGRRPLALAVASVVVMAAACTANTGGGTGNAGGTGDTGGGATGGNQPASSKFLSYAPCCSWNATWSFNPYNVNGLTMQNDFISMRLAIQKFPSLTDYEPQLAESWTTKGDELTVKLRPGVKWQDGTPVTSKDLYATAILNGTRGDAFWNDITDVTAPTEDTVVFTLRKGQPLALAENDILANIVTYPASIYGKYATEDLKKDLIAYYEDFRADPDKAAKTDESKRISAAFKQVASLKVPKLIGNGPFQLQNITTSQAKLVKWDGFYAADKIAVAGINYSNGSNQTIYPQLLSGRAQFSNVYLPPPLLQRWGKTKDADVATPLAFGFVMSFNSHAYPFDKKEVRQALAYLIPRQQMTEAAYGTDKQAGGTWKEVNTGISPTLEGLYLTPDQIGKLNKYPVDEAKATALLESVDFRKQGDQWLMPNGKPFTVAFTANADTSDIVTAFTSAAKALSAFGIKSSVKATTGAQQDADQHNGDFQIGMNFVGGNNPLGMYSTMMGTANNYSDQGNYAGKRGLGFGPKVDVPGLGNVNVPATIDDQLAATEPGPKMKELTWNWAQLVNDEVPYIWYATKLYQFSYLSKDFDNWPPKDDQGSSPLWDIMGANLSGGMVLAMEQGYIRPKG